MRAPNLQRLTEDVRALYPGVVIYGLGDAAHRAQSSDHNEDDTSGVRTPQTDADTVPEHRAIDVMLGPAFSWGAGQRLVSELIGRPENRARITLVIFNRYEYSVRTGFAPVRRTTDLHLDHVHVSGLAAADANRSAWSITRTGGATMTDWNTPAFETAEGHEFINHDVAAQRVYQLLHHADMDNGYTAHAYPHSVPAILDRIERKLDALVVAVERLAAAGAGGGVSQEQLDAAVLRALSGARFETRVMFDT